MSLYEETRELHHKAETHPFGARMAAGEITRQEWTDWLGAMFDIHRELDAFLPPSLQRGPALALDLYDMLPLRPNDLDCTWRTTNAIRAMDVLRIGGLSYILSGANLRGGQVVRKALEPEGLPVAHLTFFDDAAAADRYLKSLRERPQLAAGAKWAFQQLINIMDAIEAGG